MNSVTVGERKESDGAWDWSPSVRGRGHKLSEVRKGEQADSCCQQYSGPRDDSSGPPASSAYVRMLTVQSNRCYNRAFIIYVTAMYGTFLNTQK